MATLYKILPDGITQIKDGGSRVEAIRWNENGTLKEIVGHEPIVGCSLLVGTSFTRSFSDDYWLTTEVTEILETTENHIKFKTKNSIYIFTK